MVFDDGHVADAQFQHPERHVRAVLMWCCSHRPRCHAFSRHDRGRGTVRDSGDHISLRDDAYKAVALVHRKSANPVRPHTAGEGNQGLCDLRLYDAGADERPDLHVMSLLATGLLPVGSIGPLRAGLAALTAQCWGQPALSASWRLDKAGDMDDQPSEKAPKELQDEAAGREMEEARWLEELADADQQAPETADLPHPRPRHCPGAGN